MKYHLGSELKRYLDQKNINHSRIDDGAIVLAVKNLFEAIRQITHKPSFNVDHFRETNIQVFDYEENVFALDSESLYNCLSLLAVSLIDLGLIEIQD